jgi:hypothetical protein
MLKRLLQLRSVTGEATLTQKSASVSAAKVLRTRHAFHHLRVVSFPLTALPPRRCVALGTWNNAATRWLMTVQSSPLLLQRRSISVSYATAVPCARFNVNTKKLARITQQPTLPPTANIYIIDLRKRHVSKAKQKPNPRRTMARVIEAHRLEKMKAAMEEATDAASTPALIFLVRTDDTAKQAARRQQVMDEQLKALDAFDEFRVCVLTGPKSRHWSQYVGAEDASAASGSTAAAEPPSPLSTAPAEAEAAAVAATAATVVADVVTATRHSPTLNHVGDATGGISTAEAKDVSSNAVGGTAGEGEAEEMEWEEVEEEVEEVVEEEQEEAGVENNSSADSVPRQQQQRPHELDTQREHEEPTTAAKQEVRDDDDESSVVETPSPPAVTPGDTASAFAASAVSSSSSSSKDLPSSGAAAVCADSNEGDDNPDLHDTPTMSSEARGSAVKTGMKDDDNPVGPQEKVHAASDSAAEVDGDEDEEGADADEEEVLEEEEEAVDTNSRLSSATHDMTSLARGEGSASTPIDGEVLEEFDLDGPIIADVLSSHGAVEAHDAAAEMQEERAPSLSTATAAATPVAGAASEPKPSAKREAAQASEQTSPPTAEAAHDVEQRKDKSSLASSGEAPKEDAPHTQNLSSTKTAQAEDPVTRNRTAATPPPPPPLPQPTTPMPVYPDVPARLYMGASTTYLSDRALQELPLTANVLIIDRLDWCDDTASDIDAAMEKVDPVAGHVLVYRDAYTPQSSCVVKENLVFRDALVPFIFVFRTSLSRAAAQTQQRRFIEALRRRPPGLSAEQQAQRAGQHDRTFVCVLCGEESHRGGDNPLENPQPQERGEAAVTKVGQPNTEEEEEAATVEVDEGDAPDHDAATDTDGVDVDTAEGAAQHDSSDALQRLWTMMGVSSSATVESPPTKTHSSSGTGVSSAAAVAEGRPTTPPRSCEKRHFSVPVPSYEMEEEDLADYAGGYGQAGLKDGEGSGDNDGTTASPNRRGGRSARASSGANKPFDPSTAPPTSLPTKPAPPPLSLGLLGFETVAFGKPTTYSYMSTTYGRHQEDEVPSTSQRGGREEGDTSKAAATPASVTDTCHGEGGKKGEGRASEQDLASHGVPPITTHQTAEASPASPSSSSSPLRADVSDIDVRAIEASMLKAQKPKRHRTGGKGGRSRASQRGKAANKDGDAAAAATAHEQAEDAALEAYILSLYKDSDEEDARVYGGVKASSSPRKNGRGAAAVSSARSRIKSASRLK